MALEPLINTTGMMEAREEKREEEVREVCFIEQQHLRFSSAVGSVELFKVK